MDKENEDKPFIVGLVGERARLKWGVGENWQRKSRGWFPVGIKALTSLHAYSFKMGEKNNMQGTEAYFRAFQKQVCVSQTLAILHELRFKIKAHQYNNQRSQKPTHVFIEKIWGSSLSSF